MKKPEALELADLFDRGGTNNALHNAAAKELRRLHEENKNQTVDWDVLRERYDCLMIERNHLHSLNQELVEALEGLDEAYCRAGSPLNKQERHEDRMRLIVARRVIAKHKEQA